MKTYKGMQHPELCYYPLVLGYETAGIVVAKGPDARKDLNIGDRVMINECRRNLHHRDGLMCVRVLMICIRQMKQLQKLWKTERLPTKKESIRRI